MYCVKLAWIDLADHSSPRYLRKVATAAFDLKTVTRAVYKGGFVMLGVGWGLDFSFKNPRPYTFH